MDCFVSTSVAAVPAAYSAQRREALLNAAPRLAVDALDVYVSGVNAFVPLGETAADVMGFGAGLAAVTHGALGVRNLIQADSDGSDTSAALRHRAIGIGELITAVGFVGVAAGMGPWALPLVGVGLATTNFAHFN